MDSDAVLRFISEAQAANQHPQPPHRRRVLVREAAERAPFLRDGPARRRAARRASASARSAGGRDHAAALAPIAEALDAAHAAGVVHRDLKPQNLFLAWEPSGETVPKLLDFGMAKLLIESSVQTVSGVPIGTPLYMSPEQARGEKVDGRSDVYALGVLCHEMLTGRVPFTGESPLAVLVSHLTLPPPRASEVLPELPRELDEPILAMLHKEPGGRPATAGAAIAALVPAAEQAGHVVPAGMPHLPRPRGLPAATSSSVFAAPVHVGARRRRPRRAASGRSRALRRRPKGHAKSNWPLGVGLLALAALVAISGVARWTLRRTPRRRRRAPSPAADPIRRRCSWPRHPPDPSPAPTPPRARAAPSAWSRSRCSSRCRARPPARACNAARTCSATPSRPLRLPFGKTPLELTVTAPGYEPLRTVRGARS